MATYAIGDVQGCYGELRSLLGHLQFDSEADRLWFVGDLVNRGPSSLEVLRFVRSLGDRAVTVLGNHDLHLLALARLGREPHSRKDTLGAVLAAADRDSLLEWLRTRPLLHVDRSLGFVMVHAGLAPQWDLEQARRCAGEVEAALGGPQCDALLANMYGDLPDRWSEDLGTWERLRFIVNAFTRLRYCDDQGRLVLDEKGPPGSGRRQLWPWFAAPGRVDLGWPVVFGHWSTLQLGDLDHRPYRVYPIDTGCVWGGALTALRLDDRRLFSVASEQPPYARANRPDTAPGRNQD